MSRSKWRGTDLEEMDIVGYVFNGEVYSIGEIEEEVKKQRKGIDIDDYKNSHLKDDPEPVFKWDELAIEYNLL